MKTIQDLAQEYAEGFMLWHRDDTNTIFEFLDTKIVNDYMWWNITKVWWEDCVAFDVFHEAHFWEKSFNVSIEYIEYLNEIDDSDLVALELIGIADRIKANIIYIDNYLNKW